MPDYDALSLEELVEAQRTIADLIEAKRPEVLEKLKAQMLAYGFEPEDLSAPAEKVKGTRTPAKPKYQDPATGATWTGKGNQPAWVKAHLEAGGKKEELLIPSAEEANASGLIP